MAPAPRGSEHASPGRARRWRFLGAEEGNEVRGVVMMVMMMVMVMMVMMMVMGMMVIKVVFENCDEKRHRAL